MGGGKTDLLVSSNKKEFFGNVGSMDIELLEKQFEICEGPVNSLIINLLNPNYGRERLDNLMSIARACGDKAIGNVYPEGSRLSDILKRFANEIPKPPSKPSKPQTSEGQQ